MIFLYALLVWLGITAVVFAWIEWGPTYVPAWMTKDLSRKGPKQ